MAERIRRASWRVFLAASLALCAAAACADEDAVSACLNSHGSAPQTIAQCTTAIAAAGIADERRAAALTQRGLAKMARRDLDNAREDFDAAIRLDDKSAWAYNSRAVCAMQRRDVQGAIADYEHAVSLKPGYASAWANLGYARLIQGDPDRALPDLDKAVQLAPPRIEIVLVYRGRAWLAKADYERALENFSAALKANPRYANALSGRAFVHFCQGAFDAAAADFRSERKLRNDAESAIDLLVAARRDGNDGRAELAEATKGLDASQGTAPGIALFSGVISPEQALQASEDRDPGMRRERMCPVQFQVGEWYLLQSNPAQAREHFTMARETCDPSHPEFAAAGAELSRLK